jgi:hypothetical protein
VLLTNYFGARLPSRHYIISSIPQPYGNTGISQGINKSPKRRNKYNKEMTFLTLKITMIPHTPVYMHRFPVPIHNMPNPVQVEMKAILYEYQVESL